MVFLISSERLKYIREGINIINTTTEFIIRFKNTYSEEGIKEIG